MIPEFGFGVLLVTFLVSLYGVGAAIYGARHDFTRIATGGSPEASEKLQAESISPRERRDAQAWVESARSAMLLTWPLLTLAALTLIYLLVNGQYQVQYVYNVTSSTMPLYLRITALWGGQSGSLLFWSWLMSAFASAVTLRKWERDGEFLPWVIVVALVTLAFFVGLILFFENPFQRFWVMSDGVTQVVSMFQPAGATPLIPPDGNGLNPLLRHPGMVLHPPMLYLGFVSFVIPYAFAIAALMTGRSDDRWIRVTRRWTLIAWLFLSLGLLLGSRWAYDVLGWGGYWGWDPVENKSLIPWLLGTAFLHSSMIQEKRGMFKNWNVMLMLLTFSAVVWGTAVVRSGVLTSVHAFAQSDLGPLFLGFIVVILGVSLYMWLSRLDTLRSENTFDSWFSREGIFLLQNVLFVSTALTVFIGTVFPIITEAINGTKVTVGPPFYNQVAVPQMAVLVFLMGVAPLLAWRKANSETLGRMSIVPLAASVIVVIALVVTGTRQVIQLLLFALCAYTFVQTLLEYGRGVIARMRTTQESAPVALWHLVQRNQRRYGGYLIHLGIVLIAIGATGKGFYGTDVLRNVKLNESFSLGDYTFTYRGVQTVPCEFNDCQTVQAAVLVTSALDGHVIGGVYPHRDAYPVQQETSTIADTTGSFNEEVYVILGGWENAGETATFQVYINPLINWIWVGGAVLILGFLVAFWKLEPATVVRHVPAVSSTVGAPSK